MGDSKRFCNKANEKDKKNPVGLGFCLEAVSALTAESTPVLTVFLASGGATGVVRESVVSQQRAC